MQLSGGTAIATHTEKPDWHTIASIRLNRPKLNAIEKKKLEPLFTPTVLNALETSTSIKLHQALRLQVKDHVTIGGDNLIEGTKIVSDANPKESKVEDYILANCQSTGKRGTLRQAVHNAFRVANVDSAAINKGVILNSARFSGQNVFDLFNADATSFDALKLSARRLNRIADSEVLSSILTTIPNSFVLNLSDKTPTWLAVEQGTSATAAMQTLREIMAEEGRAYRDGHTVDGITLGLKEARMMEKAKITLSSFEGEQAIERQEYKSLS